MALRIGRTGANRASAAALIATLLLASAAVAIVVPGGLSLPGVTAPEAVTIEPVALTTEGAGDDGAGDDRPAAPEFDPARAAAMLNLVDNAPQPDVDDEPETGDTPGGEQGTSAGGGPAGSSSLQERIAYLGRIGAGARRMALLTFDGRQVIVGVGEMISAEEGILLHNVMPKFVFVEQNGERTRIVKKAASGPSVTLIAGGEIDVIAAQKPTRTDLDGTFKGRLAAPDELLSERGRRRRDRIRQMVEDGTLEEDRARRLLELGDVDPMENIRAVGRPRLGNRANNRANQERSEERDERSEPPR